ncbi:MAG: hypothetical protein HRT71_17875 [Flavobacteriales bacterium]|nr:hypothetical protein [Flavobacteriales bacterium]
MMCIYNGIHAQSFGKSEDIQWACEVGESSLPHFKDDYSPKGLIGKPENLFLRPYVFENTYILCYKETDDIEERTETFVTVKFCTPQKVNRLVVFENHTPGAITKLILLDADGKEYLVYGESPKAVMDASRLLQVEFPLTTYDVLGLECIPTLIILTKNGTRLTELELSILKTQYKFPSVVKTWDQELIVNTMIMLL